MSHVNLGRRQLALKIQAIVYFGVCALFLSVGIAEGEEAAYILPGLSVGFFLAGFFCILLARKLPTQDILQLAKSRNGLLTLSEITLALNIDPRQASRALAQLQSLKLANPRWQEITRNIWEFPDYMELLLEKSLQLAHQSGGKITLKELLAQGYSLDTAQQTLDALSNKGLAQQDPNSTPANPTLIITPQ
jgi:hypothetical protein